MNNATLVFQSTPPAWGATQARRGLAQLREVSIHAPRVGGDSRHPCPASRCSCFNPRPPRGGRPPVASFAVFPNQFQSTPPAWGATTGRESRPNRVRVSIHAPRVGGDRGSLFRQREESGFNPRPRVGGDVPDDAACFTCAKFQSTPPRGGRHQTSTTGSNALMFQSTPPAWGATTCLTC